MKKLFILIILIMAIILAGCGSVVQIVANVPYCDTTCEMKVSEMEFAGADEDGIILWDSVKTSEGELDIFFVKVSRSDGEPIRETEFTVMANDSSELGLRCCDSCFLILAPAAVYKMDYSLGAPVKISFPGAMAEANVSEYYISDDLKQFVWRDETGARLISMDIDAIELMTRLDDKYWTEKSGSVYEGTIPDLEPVILENNSVLADSVSPSKALNVSLDEGYIGYNGFSGTLKNRNGGVKLVIRDSDGKEKTIWKGETADFIGFSNDGFAILKSENGFIMVYAFSPEIIGE